LTIEAFVHEPLSGQRAGTARLGRDDESGFEAVRANEQR
jgi:hypothetical protein